MLALLLAAAPDIDLEYLHSVAKEVVEGSVVRSGETLKGGQKNTTGATLRVPGATANGIPRSGFAMPQ